MECDCDCLTLLIPRPGKHLSTGYTNSCLTLLKLSVLFNEQGIKQIKCWCSIFTVVIKNNGNLRLWSACIPGHKMLLSRKSELILCHHSIKISLTKNITMFSCLLVLISYFFISREWKESFCYSEDVFLITWGLVWRIWVSVHSEALTSSLPSCVNKFVSVFYFILLRTPQARSWGSWPGPWY